jgi:hypothetical protein
VAELFDISKVQGNFMSAKTTAAIKDNSFDEELPRDLLKHLLTLPFTLPWLQYNGVFPNQIAGDVHLTHLDKLVYALSLLYLPAINLLCNPKIE